MNRSIEVPDAPGEVDEETVDRLLAGRVHPDDAPARYRDAARVLRALTSPAREDEVSQESVDVRRAVVVLERSRTGDERSSRGRTVTRARRVALIVVGTIVATAGAAGANVLPEPLERPVAVLLSHVGIGLPSLHDERGGRPAASPATERSIDRSRTAGGLHRGASATLVGRGPVSSGARAVASHAGSTGRAHGASSRGRNHPAARSIDRRGASQRAIAHGSADEPVSDQTLTSRHGPPSDRGGVSGRSARA